MHASALKHGHNISFADCSIAAIAATHGYGIATRYVKDFRGSGIKVVDPWRWQYSVAVLTTSRATSSVQVMATAAGVEDTVKQGCFND